MTECMHNWSMRIASLGALVPLLQIMSAQSISTLVNNHKSVKLLASQCFKELDPFNLSRNIPDSYQKHEQTAEKLQNTKLTGKVLIQMEACANIADRIFRSNKAALAWLDTLRSLLLSRSNDVPSYISLLLGSLLVSPCEEVCNEILGALKKVVQLSPSQSLHFLPLFLCKLSQEPSPSLKLKFLYAITDLATHKIAIGPILKTIQSLSQSPALRAISLRLLLKLWYQQSRIFPHLQKALLRDEQDIKDKDTYEELQIAKAATVRDICKHSPSQHGPDLLGLLSSLIDKNIQVCQNSSSSIFAVVFALDGIKFLCEAEVVDLCTVWKVLATKISQDKRPLVVKALCELFSMIPNLETDTKDYEEFKTEALLFLWKATHCKIASVASAAFNALSNFNIQDFKLHHIPKVISSPIKAKLMSRKSTTAAEEDDLQSLEYNVNMSSPPGSAYLALLLELPEEVFPAYQNFLTSLIRQESLSIPRGVAHNAVRGSQSHDRSLRGIPSFIESQYEKSKTPGLNTGLAVGLLFSYEPPFEVHDGKRARRYHLNCARSYKHMLDSLLHEVPIQPSEWHRNLLLPQAWTCFMTRLYHACVLGRKSEILMQCSRGHIEDKTEANEKQNNAWLWVRDTLTEQLQSASRGNPSVQGNSVLALAGLAVAVSTHVAQLANNDESDDAMDERHRTRDWLCVIADTLMVVLDGNYKARTAPLTWCQQVSSPTSTASSLLARACAALSLSQMVPVLISLDLDRIKAFNEALKVRVPGQAKAGSSSLIQVHCSLGLGLLLSKLYEEHFSELAGNEGYMMMSTSLDVLEATAFSHDLENKEGASLGIGLALSSLCKENIVDSRVHLLAMHQQLKGLLDNYTMEPNNTFQVLCFSFSLVTANAYHTSIISGEEASQCIKILKHLAGDYGQAVGVTLSLGLLLHALLSSGYVSVQEMVMQQMEIWESFIKDKQNPTLQRLAGVNGIMGLLGSEQGFFEIDSSCDDFETAVKGKAGGVLKILKELISSPDDVGLASNVAWLLGHLYSSTTSSPITRTSVPANYSYLPDASILRGTFDFLVDAGKSGPHLQYSCHVVGHVLASLLAGPQGVLPPVNWASLLGPIMRNGFGEEASRLCLQFAIKQAKSSSSLMSFLSSWLSSGLFNSLQTACQTELFQSLPKLIFVVPSARVQEFLKGPVITSFDQEEVLVLWEAILRGLLSSLQVKDPPKSVFGWVCAAVKQIHAILSQERHIKDCDILMLLADCLYQTQSDQLDQLTQAPNLTSVVIRCHLVTSGQAPIKWLNSCVIWLLNTANQESSKVVLWVMLRSLFSMESKYCKTEDRLAWFIDLISQIKISVTSDLQTDEPLKLGLALLSGVAMSFSRSHLLLNLESLAASVPSSCSEEAAAMDRNLRSLVCQFSCSMVELMMMDQWKHAIDKVLEWLFIVLQSPGCQANSSLNIVLEECIVAFKDSEPFKKITIWTEALSRAEGNSGVV